MASTDTAKRIFISRVLWTVVKTVHSVEVVWKASRMCLCSSRFDSGRATTPEFGANLGLPKKEGDPLPLWWLEYCDASIGRVHFQNVTKY